MPRLTSSPAAPRAVASAPRFDLEHWRGLVERRGALRVLELACGTGRVTIPLARAGVEMIGLDCLYDLRDLLRGHFSVFFFRNLGIAPLHFYWTAGVMKAAGLPIEVVGQPAAPARR